MKNKKWEEIIDLADKHGFLVDSYGGVALLATSDKQEKIEEVKKNESN